MDRYALVSMTNKDVYYVSVEAANKLLMVLTDREGASFFRTFDAKSGAQIAIALDNISSVVMPKGFSVSVGGTGTGASNA